MKNLILSIPSKHEKLSIDYTCCGSCQCDDNHLGLPYDKNLLLFSSNHKLIGSCILWFRFALLFSIQGSRILWAHTPKFAMLPFYRLDVLQWLGSHKQVHLIALLSLVLWFHTYKGPPQAILFIGLLFSHSLGSQGPIMASPSMWGVVGPTRGVDVGPITFINTMLCCSNTSAQVSINAAHRSPSM